MTNYSTVLEIARQKQKTIEQELKKDTEQMLKNYQADLQSVQDTTKADLMAHQQWLKSQLSKLQASESKQIEQLIDQLEQRNNNEKALTIAKNRWLWVVLGLVGAVVLVLMLWSMILAKNITAQHAELANIKQASQQSPTQAQILAKVSVGQNDDGTLWIEPKNPKKAQLGKSTDGKPLMILE